jgi:folate-dependent phosphoribosylglycinamide formyltransferase PurN
MKLVVLGQDRVSTWMMVNALRKDFPGLEVLIEKPMSRFHFLRRRVARLGVWSVIGQILFISMLPLLRLRGRGHRRALIEASKLDQVRPLDVLVEHVDSVNSDLCIAWLRAAQPDVVVVNGTRIISPAVLSACDAIFLNTHCGITPAYRGVHGGYWALFAGDRENVGVTIHILSDGIDTGEIVYQQKINVDEKDDFLTYPIKQYLAGIPLMRRAIQDIAGGRLRTSRRDDLPSFLWAHPTLWQYLLTRFRKGVR